MAFRFLGVIAAMAATVASASAQVAPKQFSGSVPPVTGSSSGRAPTTYQGFGNTDPNLYRNMDLSGKPCLDVGGYGRPFATNAKLYDHVIVATNRCPKRIEFQVCYYQTRSCINVVVPGGERKEAILGTQPATKDFRFEFREKS